MTKPVLAGADYIEAAAHSPLLQQLPADMRLLTDLAPELAPTAGWLRSATAAGRRSLVPATRRRS